MDGTAGSDALGNARGLPISPPDQGIDLYPAHAGRDIAAMLAPFG